MSQRARDGRTPISLDKDLFHTLNDSNSAIWSNLVQFDFQLCLQKHPAPAKDSLLHRESSMKYHRKCSLQASNPIMIKPILFASQKEWKQENDGFGCRPLTTIPIAVDW